MKCIKLVVFSLLTFNISKAQLTKGNWMLGGNLSFASTKYNSANYTPPTYTNVIVDINPNVAYFVANNLNFGIKTTFNKSYRVNATSYTSFRLGPSCRYYFLDNEQRINFLAEVGYRFGLEKGAGWQTSTNTYAGGLGCVAFFNSSVGIEFMVNYISDKLDDYTGRNNTIQLALGLQVHLIKN
ncbi:MAG: hypothetical protein KBF36_03915 [Chitinophagaceae bacterium]|nr:hypothetical protein [Chitinophagaceae bacterium]